MGRREITQSLRDEALHLVVMECHSVAQVCAMLGIGSTALRRWIERWRLAQAPAVNPTTPDQDRQRIAELEARVARLQEERDLLKNPSPSSCAIAIA